MECKIGRFAGYVPKQNFFNVLLEILYISSLSERLAFKSPSDKMHRFFYEMKEQYPQFFEDIYFNHDPDFPYSEQIEEGFIRLQESGYVTRPNPSFSQYMIYPGLKEKAPDQSIEDYEIIESIADKFSSEFKLEHAPAC